MKKVTTHYDNKTQSKSRSKVSRDGSIERKCGDMDDHLEFEDTNGGMRSTDYKNKNRDT